MMFIFYFAIGLLVGTLFALRMHKVARNASPEYKLSQSRIFFTIIANVLIWPISLLVYAFCRYHGKETLFNSGIPGVSSYYDT